MNAIFSVALVLGMGSSAGAAEVNAEDPVGTWQCSYEIGGQERMVALEVKKEGDKLVATMNWADQKDEPAKDLKFQDGKLTFSVVRKFMDNEIPIDYTLTIKGDELTGKGEAEFGGNVQEFEIQGKREKKDKA